MKYLHTNEIEAGGSEYSSGRQEPCFTVTGSTGQVGIQLTASRSLRI